MIIASRCQAVLFSWKSTKLCPQDLNSDSVTDCVASGKSGLLVSVDGKSGELLWSYKVAFNSFASSVDVFAPIFLHDLNSDGVSDLLLAQGRNSFPVEGAAAAAASSAAADLG